MSKQYERPVPTLQQFCQTAGVPYDPSAKMSGGQVVNLREAWAINIGASGARAHFFKRDALSASVIADQIDTATSLCNLSAPVRALYGAGNYDRCSRCQQKWQRLAFPKV